MADESNDMAILKQLVVYGRAVVDGKFLGIQDLVFYPLVLRTQIICFFIPKMIYFVQSLKFPQNGSHELQSSKKM